VIRLDMAAVKKMAMSCGLRFSWPLLDLRNVQCTRLLSFSLGSWWCWWVEAARHHTSGSAAIGAALDRDDGRSANMNAFGQKRL
jgi:hypothetical protein